MILKPFAEAPPHIDELQKLKEEAPAEVQKKIDVEIRQILAGHAAEKQVAYELGFQFGNGKNNIVLHDLRIEHNNRVAQIDHLILFRTLEAHVIETKNFSSGFKITDRGEFLRWNKWTKQYEAMPSPIEQATRHITVLKDLIKDKVAMPTRLGITLGFSFKPVVLVNTKARIIRPKGFNTDNVISLDAYSRFLDDQIKSTNPLVLMKAVSQETLLKIAEQIQFRHLPKTFGWRARFGLPETPPQAPAQVPAEQVPVEQAPIVIVSLPISEDSANQLPSSPPIEAATVVSENAGQCASCDVGVDKKTVTFCKRFNKKRFGGNVYCRSCQSNFPTINA